MYAQGQAMPAEVGRLVFRTRLNSPALQGSTLLCSPSSPRSRRACPYSSREPQQSTSSGKSGGEGKGPSACAHMHVCVCVHLCAPVCAACM